MQVNCSRNKKEAGIIMLASFYLNEWLVKLQTSECSFVDLDGPLIRVIRTARSLCIDWRPGVIVIRPKIIAALHQIGDDNITTC